MTSGGPVRGAGLRIEHLLRAEGLAAHLVEPAGDGTGPGVVVLGGEGGAGEAALAACHRLAQAGFLALTPALAATGALADPEAVVDLDAAVEHLRSHPRTGGRVGAVGFGWGGRLALVLATSPAAPDRVVACDSPAVVRRTAPVDLAHPQVPADRLPFLRAPLLWLSGATSDDPAPGDVEEVRAALEQRGLEHRVAVLPGPSTGLPGTGPETAAAWDEVLAWLDGLR